MRSYWDSLCLKGILSFPIDSREQHIDTSEHIYFIYLKHKLLISMHFVLSHNSICCANKLKRCSCLLTCRSPLCTYFILSVEVISIEGCCTQFINKMFRITKRAKSVHLVALFISSILYLFLSFPLVLV